MFRTAIVFCVLATAFGFAPAAKQASVSSLKAQSKSIPFLPAPKNLKGENVLQRLNSSSS
jgi:hypothetical protein